MQFHDGPVPRVRRHLPPTPGIRVLPAAPPKPNRNTSTTAAGSEQPAKVSRGRYCRYGQDGRMRPGVKGVPGIN